VNASVSVDAETASSLAKTAVTSGAASTLISGMKPKLGPNGVSVQVDPKAATQAMKTMHGAGATTTLMSGMSINATQSNSSSGDEPKPTGGLKLSDMIQMNNVKAKTSKYPASSSSGNSILGGLPAAPPRLFTKPRGSPGLPPPLEKQHSEPKKHLVKAVSDFEAVESGDLAIATGDLITVTAIGTMKLI
jgi:hypothetical protein